MIFVAPRMLANDQSYLAHQLPSERTSSAQRSPPLPTLHFLDCASVMGVTNRPNHEYIPASGRLKDHPLCGGVFARPVALASESPSMVVGRRQAVAKNTRGELAQARPGGTDRGRHYDGFLPESPQSDTHRPSTTSHRTTGSSCLRPTLSSTLQVSFASPGRLKNEKSYGGLDHFVADPFW